MMTSPLQKWLLLKQRNYLQSMKLFVCRCSLSLLISDPQVMMLEVDFMTTEGNFDEALAQIEEIISLSDGDDAIPHVFKANTLAQKVYTLQLDSLIWIAHRPCSTSKLLNNTAARLMQCKDKLSCRSQPFPLPPSMGSLARLAS
jgi:hypothetical protein